MIETLIVGFDGTEPSHRAVTFAANIAAATGAKIHIVHVLEWSPYSFLTPQELEDRHRRRTEELTRAAQLVDPVLKDLEARGIKASSDIRYGHAAELICQIAEQNPDSQIIIGKTGSFALARRVLGGLVLALLQSSPVPLTVVP
jgi:nucleotide-binding universal stress UspA family protein